MKYALAVGGAHIRSIPFHISQLAK